MHHTAPTPDGPPALRTPFDWDSVYRGDARDIAAPDPLLLAPAYGLPSGKALDMGCGAGGNTLELARRGWRVTGVDIAPRAIAGARAGACARGLTDLVELVVADSAVWRPETGYDFVLSSYALPPRGPARTATLVSLAAALAPGAILSLGEWDEEACDWGQAGDLVTVDEMRTDLAGLGLDILRADRRRVPLHQHPGHEQPPGEDHAVVVIARKPHDTLEATR
ncbi:class I SAM-dependent methyltransferase [Streptomyces coffeae]|uniref:Class I SAM-dependent methyltransferase n=1 Tax=Streptomyces coffeae TaxID=621382 RepID=A0ABS1NLT9_9ACTN|nr:class I SAM-dependent methyltransferase [Streptomyces coffeae]MBL1101067.1 class I SAM-dependent methyltransferase [Streptomyces coffeae]